MAPDVAAELERRQLHDAVQECVVSLQQLVAEAGLSPQRRRHLDRLSELARITQARGTQRSDDLVLEATAATLDHSHSAGSARRMLGSCVSFSGTRGGRERSRTQRDVLTSHAHAAQAAFALQTAVLNGESGDMVLKRRQELAALREESKAVERQHRAVGAEYVEYLERKAARELVADHHRTYRGARRRELRETQTELQQARRTMLAGHSTLRSLTAAVQRGRLKRTAAEEGLQHRLDDLQAQLRDAERSAVVEQRGFEREMECRRGRIHELDMAIRLFSPTVYTAGHELEQLAAELEHRDRSSHNPGATPRPSPSPAQNPTPAKRTPPPLPPSVSLFSDDPMLLTLAKTKAQLAPMRQERQSAMDRFLSGARAA